MMQLISDFGVVGMMFIMWYFNEKKNDKFKNILEKAEQREGQLNKVNEQLMSIIEKNTQAFAKFAERLKTKGIDIKDK